MDEPDQPRSLASREAADERRRELRDAAHMSQLRGYVQALREEGRGIVPDFDPSDGGVNARILFVLEKPGPRTDPTSGGSGFVSMDNDDPTAEAAFRFMLQAKIPRRSVLIWNLIPWWNGQIKYKAAERRLGLQRFATLLDRLPQLQAVIAVGKQARSVRPICEARALGYANSIHPSGRNRATRPEQWACIPEIWSNAWGQLCNDA